MKYEKHIFVCINERPPDSPKGCCSALGGKEIRYEFVKLINQHGLKGKVRSNKCGCLDACEFGPTVVIYPEGLWYTGVRVEDVLEIFKKSVLKDEPVHRLLATSKTWSKLSSVRESGK
ncbi:MAG: (2Fe-2S) ferredoxin domain-containing protein [Candidatus Neomarinimicrobiota bacterium]|nr:(2Fe-2S) ferredoxin domain-containing protein [Candidatus Neomarinimicrobiota bacterium]